MNNKGNLVGKLSYLTSISIHDLKLSTSSKSCNYLRISYGSFNIVMFQF